MGFKTFGQVGGGVGGSADLQLSSSASIASPSSTKWRLLCHTPQSGGANIAFAELKVYTTIGGTNIANTASAVNASYNNGSYPKENIIDGDAATFWWTDSNEQWIELEFSSPIAVVEYAVQGRASFFNDSPKSFEFQFYDGTQYVTVHSMSNETWTDGQIHTYQPATSIYDCTLTVAPAVTVTNWRAILSLASDGTKLAKKDFTGTSFSLVTTSDQSALVSVYPSTALEYGTVNPVSYGPITPV